MVVVGEFGGEQIVFQAFKRQSGVCQGHNLGKFLLTLGVGMVYDGLYVLVLLPESIRSGGRLLRFCVL